MLLDWVVFDGALDVNAYYYGQNKNYAIMNQKLMTIDYDRPIHSIKFSFFFG